MAFSFRSKTKTSGLKDKIEKGNNLPKLSGSQISKLTKAYPPWLRGNVELKYLPALYQGVLGQVQLQPDINLDNGTLFNQHRLKNKQTQDYMNKFTDTERTKKLLSASRLPNETLATIWAHVNQTFPGQLTNREFCLALALVAHFQRSTKENSDNNTNVTKSAKQNDANSNKTSCVKSSNDPFDLVKHDEKPPVPILYPSQSSPRKMSNSSSVPNKLGSDILLVDLGEDNRTEATSDRRLDCIKGSSYNKLSMVNLMDMDGNNDHEFLIARLTDMWTRLMLAIRSLFKRSFDILNVENCRKSALEALRSEEGILFVKQLSLTYPLAHNVKSKIDEMIALQHNSEQNKQSNADYGFQLKKLDRNFALLINDLMLSINEYWAVLINLFHESGQTNFIEVIIDSLDVSCFDGSEANRVGSLRELIDPKDANKCSICLRREYLSSCILATKSISDDDLELIVEQDLITKDDCYYYHARCANFWLNQVVDSHDGTLPFYDCGTKDNNVLTPNAINSPIV